MTRYIALLRGINVGGHNVRMARLREVFEAMGFADPATYIASGNVIIDADQQDATALERRVEAGLSDALGYAVPTMVRTCQQLRDVVTHEPFERPGKTLSVTFLRQAPSAATSDRILALGSADEQFDVRGRELYWLTQIGVGRSPVAAPLAKLLGTEATMRNIRTVRKLVAKFCDGL